MLQTMIRVCPAQVVAFQRGDFADPASGTVQELRPAVGRDWMPIAATLSADDRRLAVSYHGPNTTGADVIDLAAGQREPCPAGHPRIGCLRSVHGAAAFAGSELIATTGSRS